MNDIKRRLLILNCPQVNSWTALNNPIARRRLWMEARGWWGADQDAAARAVAAPMAPIPFAYPGPAAQWLQFPSPTPP